MTPEHSQVHNPERLEAVNHKYFTCRILRLSTGNYAVFNSKIELIYIGPDPLSCDLGAQPQAYPDPVRPSHGKKLDLSRLHLLLRKKGPG